MENFKKDFITKIENNIKHFGHHITMVLPNISPRFAYTIGVNKTLGVEFIFAGGIFYMEEQVYTIINEVISIYKSDGMNHTTIKTSLGTFRISTVNHSWSDLMMLGFYKIYENNKFPVFQIIPSDENATMDIPDMSKEWNSFSQPVWQWLSKDWNYPVPEDSKVIINLDVLKGHVVTEVMRWEINEWEAFAGAGPDVNEDDIRIISIGTLLGIDSSLEIVLNLNIGKGIWRNYENLIWNAWN